MTAPRSMVRYNITVPAGVDFAVARERVTSVGVCVDKEASNIRFMSGLGRPGLEHAIRALPEVRRAAIDREVDIASP